AENITIDHNTAFQTDFALGMDGSVNRGLIYRNNLTMHNSSGIWASGYGTGKSALDGRASNYTFARNVLIGGTAALYAPLDTNNYFPTTTDLVGFVSLANRDYR